MDVRQRPIGFFDSGIGGISVLKETIRLMPNENYIYFGDSKNAPYGTKTVDEVRRLSFKAAEFLISKEVKAIVVACNTATSAAINQMRDNYKQIPVIGIEPALKPAVELNRQGKIIIMATPMTLSEKKFKKLMGKYNERSEIVPLPCPNLVEYIEKGIVKGEEIQNYIIDILKPYVEDGINAVVLGCTHYPFIKGEISKIVGLEVPIIDGAYGTAKQLKKLLRENNLINCSKEIGTVDIYNSLEEKYIIDLSYELLND